MGAVKAKTERTSYTRQEIAERNGVSEKTVKRWEQLGLKTFRLGRVVRILHDEEARFLREHEH